MVSSFWYYSSVKNKTCDYGELRLTLTSKFDHVVTLDGANGNAFTVFKAKIQGDLRPLGHVLVQERTGSMNYTRATSSSSVKSEWAK